MFGWFYNAWQWLFENKKTVGAVVGAACAGAAATAALTKPHTVAHQAAGKVQDLCAQVPEIPPPPPIPGK